MAGRRGVADEDVDPLCCCEFRNANGETRSVMQCDDLDDLVDSVCCRCRLPERESLRRTADDMSDRVRVPCPGGAKPVPLWLMVPGSITAFAALLSHARNPILGLLFPFIHVTVAMLLANWLRRRIYGRKEHTRLFMGWGVTMVLHAAWAGYRFALPLLNTAQAAVLYSGAAAAVASILLFHTLDPGVVRACEGASAAGNAPQRAARFVPALGAHVRGYDHYCTWVDATVGSGNHRAFHAFLVLIAALGTLFASAACQAHCALVASGSSGSWPAREAAAEAMPGSSTAVELSLLSPQATAQSLTCAVATLWHGVSSPLLFAALHVMLAVVPVSALLAWQLHVVSRGHTTYTLQQRQSSKERVPAPSLRALVAFYAGRGPRHAE